MKKLQNVSKEVVRKEQIMANHNMKFDWTIDKERCTQCYVQEDWPLAEERCPLPDGIHGSRSEKKEKELSQKAVFEKRVDACRGNNWQWEKGMKAYNPDSDFEFRVADVLTTEYLRGPDGKDFLSSEFVPDFNDAKTARAFAIQLGHESVPLLLLHLLEKRENGLHEGTETNANANTSAETH